MHTQNKVEKVEANQNRPKSKKRKSQIIAQLCDLSRNGWKNAKPYDYEPLEKELRGYYK